jgi:hypothetical protein
VLTVDFLHDQTPLLGGGTVVTNSPNAQIEPSSRTVATLRSRHTTGLVLLWRLDFIMRGDERAEALDRLAQHSLAVEMHCNWRPIWIYPRARLAC